MILAVLGDIHSNSFALRSVVNDLKKHGIDRLVIVGDTFGYYPWASETYALLSPYLNSAISIKGNHDQLVLDQHPPIPVPSYWQAAKNNELDLKKDNSGALNWLHDLEFKKEFEIDKIKITLCHGTPNDPANGRYYPDNEQEYSWFPRADEMLIMGHTHYPFQRLTKQNGLIINPGSVGQSRDGNPMPSWGILDTSKKTFSMMRSTYDNLQAIALLNELHWERGAVASLNKVFDRKAY